MNLFVKRIFGTKKYLVNCSAPARLCGRLMSRYSDSVFGVKVKSDNSFEFWCIGKNAKKINEFLLGYGCEITEMCKKGLPYFLTDFRRKPGIIAGLVLVTIMIVYGNRIVWNIDITGNEQIGDREIESILSDVGFAAGKTYNPKKLSSICNKFILRDDRFTRIAINMSGNAAFIEVTERTKKSNTESAPSDSGIVSAFDCIIERPEVICGTSLVKKGDVVEKGTMLISPVELGTDGNEYISGAKGKIYAKTTENFVVMIPFEKLAVSPETEPVTENKITFLGLGLILSNPLNKSCDKYLCAFSDKQLGLSEDILLPFEVSSIEKRGYTTALLTIDEQQAEKRAYEVMYEKISRELSECDILSTEFAVSSTDKYVILHCKAECLRDVAEHREK